MGRIKKEFDRAGETLQNGIFGCSPKTMQVSSSSGSLSVASKVLMKANFAPVLAILGFGLAIGLAAATPVQTTASKSTTSKKKKKRAVVKSSAVRPAATKATAAVATTKTGTRRKVWVQTWDEPTYKDSAAGDHILGDDPEVRKAAVEGLGPYNGSVVVVDPNTGRVLTMVNQQLALGGGFQPCSTIKVSVALAALREGLVERTSPVRFYSRRSLDLTDALAFSNNYYFGNLGVKLGYERVNYYAHLFGYGEKAGLNIEGEHPGYFPPAPPKNGGMMMLTSFGEEISQTPL